MNNIKTYRIKNIKTGEYLQRNGFFGKLARNYAAIGHLTLSILETYNYLKDKDNLIIEEITTEVTQTISLEKFYEEKMTERELRIEKEKRAYKNARKRQLLEELEKLNNADENGKV